ncbi:hypothetical protein DL770_005457 [Monosporascus sp. CRB-9-2]|nr:hypothetical protein DL770_005457 [Monosporascus sp. CRB-9-2]
MDADTEVSNDRDNGNTDDHDNGALVVRSARTELIPKHERIRRRRMKEAQREYGRGSKIDTKGIKDKKLRRNLSNLEHKYKTATIRAKDAEVLLENTAGFLEPEHELERTYKISQEDIQDNVAVETAKKRFELNLSDKLGPYISDYSRNGRDLLLAGRKGHVAAMDGLSGYLKYQDVSTGQLVSEIPTKLGPPVSLTQNPYNAVLHCGHQNGTVTLWSPTSQEPLVKLLAHKGPVRSIAVDREGRYMVSAGQERKMAVWDIRMFKEVNSYFTRQPASSLAISDRNLTAVGWGTQTTIWKDLFVKHRAEQEKVQSPYMNWGGEGKRVERVRWCPYEDLLGVSHDSGFSSIIVPGAGEANFDALEVNPFETTKQRQETEVKSLLNKLQPEMIALDPNFIGTLDLRSEQQRQAERDLDAKPVDIETEIRNKARGRNSALSKYLRKQRKRNVVDEKKLKAEEIWRERQEKRDKQHEEKQASLGPALGRFARKE